LSLLIRPFDCDVSDFEPTNVDTIVVTFSGSLKLNPDALECKSLSMSCSKKDTRSKMKLDK